MIGTVSLYERISRGGMLNTSFVGSTKESGRMDPSPREATPTTLAVSLLKMARTRFD